jgi:hypothetical protein
MSLPVLLPFYICIERELRPPSSNQMDSPVVLNLAHLQGCAFTSLLQEGAKQGTY